MIKIDKYEVEGICPRRNDHKWDFNTLKGVEKFITDNISFIPHGCSMAIFENVVTPKKVVRRIVKTFWINLKNQVVFE